MTMDSSMLLVLFADARYEDIRAPAGERLVCAAVSRCVLPLLGSPYLRDYPDGGNASATPDGFRRAVCSHEVLGMRATSAPDDFTSLRQIEVSLAYTNLDARLDYKSFAPCLNEYLSVERFFSLPTGRVVDVEIPLLFVADFNVWLLLLPALAISVWLIQASRGAPDPRRTPRVGYALVPRTEPPVGDVEQAALIHTEAEPRTGEPSLAAS